MLINEIARKVRQQMAEKSESVARSICSGAATDYAEYKAMCGRLRGHQDALEAIDAVMTNLNEDDDD